MVDLTKVVVIVNLEAPNNVKQLHATLGHMGYYRKFIKAYMQFASSMEKLLKKDVTLFYDEDCYKKFRHFEGENGHCACSSVLGLEKGVSCSCGYFLYCARCNAAQLGEGGIDHLIVFTSRKLSKAEKNYLTTKREGLAMVYVLQRLSHYLIGTHFNMYTYHYALKYLVNKPTLVGKICRWLLFFQEYDFKVTVKPTLEC